MDRAGQQDVESRFEPIAIIGAGCRFPGADDLESFWQLLRNGVDAVTGVPADRWDADQFYEPQLGTPGKMNTRWGGFLKDVESADARFFGISRGEASSMDPQQHLLLEVTWQALENAAIPAERIRGSRTGVFIGISGSEYGLMCLGDIQAINAYSLIGNHCSIAPNRISNYFDLHGPSVALDTACSSSLVAVHMACRSLRDGESAIAIAGGVNAIVRPNVSVAMSHAWILSADGHSKPFDAAADGYVRGEGCGIVILKRLSDALKDGDHIQAVIRGSAVNQDGHTANLTAPNPRAQQMVIEQALRNAGVSPREIGYVEAHGVGSKLTDAAELQALFGAFGTGAQASTHCRVGSVKGNIGHLEAAAGIAALIKVVQCLAHHEIPPTLHLKTLSPDVGEAGKYFAIPTHAEAWSSDDSTRIAGVNSFGIGGTNVHAILAEAPPRAASRPNDGEPQLFTLSAKTDDALRELADRYAGYIESHPEISLADICFTSSTGRSHFSRRFAAVADSPGALIDALKRGVGDHRPPLQLPGKETSERRASLTNLAGRYLNGDEIDWAELYNGRVVRKIPLPAYAFQRERYSVRNEHDSLPDAGVPAPPSEFSARLNAAPIGRRMDIFREHVRNEVRSVLGRPPADDIDSTTGFFQLGMTSLMAIELHRRLQSTLGANAIPPTAIFDFSNVQSLTDYLAQNVLHIQVSTAAQAASMPGVSTGYPVKEPVAIIGMGCRYPGGADSPEAFWNLLRDGVDAIREVPAARWNIDAFYDSNPEAAGKMYTRTGGFIDGVDQFDAQFFGIAPREAVTMDPQQRLLLEVTWEALENAGQAVDSISKNKTGVFIGMGQHDYSELLSKSIAPENVDAHCVTGNLLSAIAGRVSHALGLQGPTLAVDTACSSSLVAIHLACQSLRSGECDLAFAGGVGLILSPATTIGLCKTNALSPEGRCKTFDASANGYARGEGCGVVLLKRLSAAVADNNNILAVIRGSAVNHDGPSSGFTVPNGMAQRAVIQTSLADAGVEPAAISYVEAHGTGTPLGDPIETHALVDVLGRSRTPDQPLMIGSVKTNIGHLEPAAGVAGLMKVVLSLQHRQIPPHLHLKKLNPRIDWGSVSVLIPAQVTPWNSSQGPRLGGVSAFGFSGTNAHVILEEAPPREVLSEGLERPVHLLTLSAKSEAALRELVSRYTTFLDDTTESLANIAYTASTGRSHFAYRLGVVAESVQQARERLATYVAIDPLPPSAALPLTRGRLGSVSPAYSPPREGESASVASAGGRSHALLISGSVQRTQRPRIAFLFTGQGSQYAGMGRQLYETQPTFRGVIDQCDEWLRDELEQSLLSVLYPKKGALIDQTAYTQPALFALEYALAELWRSWGIEPAAVMGHSVGEYVAACVAGVFSAEEGLRLIAKRGRRMQALPAGGRMAALRTDEARAAEAIRGYEDRVSIAAVNGPESVVISGAGDAVEKIAERLRQEGIAAQPLQVSHAFHSPLMDPMLDEFERLVGQAHLREPKLTFVSNLTGKVFEAGQVVQPAYWSRHLRNAVKFSSGIETLLKEGYNTIVEIGPAPALCALGQSCAPGTETDWLPSLRKNKTDWQQMLQSLAQLYVKGADVDWAGFDRDYRGNDRRTLALPTYPFQHRRYWIENRQMAAPAEAVDNGGDPFLGKRLRSPLKDIQYQARWSETRPAFLGDHRVYDAVVVPAAGYLAMVASAAEETFAGRSPALERLIFHEPLVLSEESRTVQLIFSPDSDITRQFQIVSISGGERDKDSWTLHASGMVRFSGDAIPAAAALASLEELQVSFSGKPVSAASFYQQMHGGGIQLGTSFQRLEEIWQRDGSVLARARPPENGAGSDPYVVHPGLMDSWLQVTAALIPADRLDSPWVPIGVDRVRIHRRAESGSWCYGRVTGQSGSEDSLTVTLRVFGDDGKTIAEIENLHVRRFPREALIRAARDKTIHPLYEIKWEKAEPGRDTAIAAMDSRPKSRWLILADRGGVGQRLAEAVSRFGDECRVIHADEVSNDDLDALVERVSRESDLPWQGILYLGSLDGLAAPITPESLSAAHQRDGETVLRLVQSLSKFDGRDHPRLWLTTDSAQCRPMGAAGLRGAPLWGMGSVIRLEHPDLWGGLVDLQGEPTDEDLKALSGHIRTPKAEDRIAFLDGEPHVPRLAPRASKNAQAREFEIRSDSTYLITGGLGGIGLQVAGWMAARGAKHLVLASRSNASASAAKAIEDLRRSGARVEVFQADVASEPEVRALLDGIRASMPPVRGIVHCAGIVDDGVLLNLSWKRFAAVMAPKIQGAWNLHAQTRGTDLDFFVLFSSIASVFGTPGQANYAAANAFMDTLAHHRRSEGLPAVCINWGPWDDIGMAAAVEKRAEDWWTSCGVSRIAPKRGVELLEQLLQEEATQAVVFQVEWQKFIPKFPPGSMSLFSRVARETHRDRQASPEHHALLQMLEKTLPADRTKVLVEYVQQLVLRVLGLDSSQGVDVKQPLHELGMDSLMALDLTKLLGEAADISLPATLLFNYPTVEQLAGYLDQKLQQPLSKAEPAPAALKKIDETAAFSADLDDLSRTEVEALLETELESFNDLIGR